MSDEDGADEQESEAGGYRAITSRERAAPPPGATLPLDELFYPQLYQHSRQLGALARWNGRGVFAGAGVLALGAGVGAWAAGADFVSEGVFICVILGIALLLGSLFIGRADIASARDVRTAFDQTLSMYEKHPDIKAIREHLESQLPVAPQSFVGRCREFFNL
jgi:hypothetical protein